MLRTLRSLSLTSWIFVALLVGIGIGVLFPAFATSLAPISNIFLRLIKCIVGPLLFGTLVYGIASAGELKRMGRIALKAIIASELSTEGAQSPGEKLPRFTRAPIRSSAL